MIYYKDLVWYFHTSLATFLDSGEPRAQYTSDAAYYENLNKSWGKITKMLIKPVAATEEQIERLRILNTLNSTEAWSGDCALFVQYGAVLDSAPQFLLDIKKEYSSNTFMYVRDNSGWPQAQVDAFVAGVKEHVGELIKAERDRRTRDGGYKVGSHWYHSDTFSRTQQIGLVMLGANIPAGTQWKTLENGFVEMTQTLASQIFQSAVSSDIAIFKAAEVHKAAMLASVNPTMYNFSVGWPTIYEAIP